MKGVWVATVAAASARDDLEVMSQTIGMREPFFYLHHKRTED
jgi:hypothetical protein